MCEYLQETIEVWLRAAPNRFIFLRGGDSSRKVCAGDTESLARIKVRSRLASSEDTQDCRGLVHVLRQVAHSVCRRLRLCDSAMKIIHLSRMLFQYTDTELTKKLRTSCVLPYCKIRIFENGRI